MGDHDKKNNADVMGGQLHRVEKVVKKLADELPKEELIEFADALDGGFTEHFTDGITEAAAEADPEHYAEASDSGVKEDSDKV